MRAGVARDEDGSMYCYFNRPHKGLHAWGLADLNYYRINYSDLSEGINPRWEDDEPIEVELKIEKI